MSHENLMKAPAPREHWVGLYEDDDSLVERVSVFLHGGLEKGESVVAIATPRHREGFAGRLAGWGHDARTLTETGRMVLLDAHETLSRILLDGRPDEGRFQAVIGRLVEKVESGTTRGVRAYGEMVNVLWQDGKLAEAVALERLWQRLLATHRFNLLCAYRADPLSTGPVGARLEEALSIHTHVLPLSTDSRLARALARAVDETLGPGKSESLGALVRADQFSSGVDGGIEATVLWLRQNVRARADEILRRARRHFEAAAGPWKGRG